ncbi:hypothetical protein K2173_003794 [Erythroxylum novogranatense]|uniref:BHLH domain-containing protein n=1 Tax=Erythroxylum novogranatense TaxID=1862640 RepID=A0AAV8SIT5_9ROSI|nr:hypothetical protein K2173_003794 [Erythroxylum novogranatense]
MELSAVTGARSSFRPPQQDHSGFDYVPQFGEDIQHLISVPQDNASSFTALLELPANQAVELLHSPDSTLGTPPEHNAYSPHHFKANLTFPSNSGLIERAAKFSVFAGNSSLETSSVPSNSSGNLEELVKSEPTETESYLNSSPQKTDNKALNRRSVKRKEREKKVKGSTKKCKSAENDSSKNGQNLPYVHVRARRGQATDSHSLAERARREKINAKMKLLQELVPGCNKITGTALVLDEIINHVQSLQRKVELLSMRLAEVNPRIDFNLDSILAAESGSPIESNFPGMILPMMWSEVQFNRSRQQHQQEWHFDVLHHPVWGREEDGHNFVAPENSLLSYDSPANSASLHLNQLKMEL